MLKISKQYLGVTIALLDRTFDAFKQQIKEEG